MVFMYKDYEGKKNSTRAMTTAKIKILLDYYLKIIIQWGEKMNFWWGDKNLVRRKSNVERTFPGGGG